MRTTVLALVRPRPDLVLENLLLRHQLRVLARSTRTQPHACLGNWDSPGLVLARRWCAGWREHLRFVATDTIVRWHRQGWQPRHLFRDRDAIYGREFRRRARRIGIDAITTPIHAPSANPSRSKQSGLCAENMSTTSSSSTSGICGRCKPSSCGTTTSSGRIGHSEFLVLATRHSGEFRRRRMRA